MSLSFEAWVRSDLFLHSNAWKIERLRAIERADYRCETPGCKVRHGLHAHHVLPRHSHPHLALDQLNLEVLCPECHARRHGWGRRLPAHWVSLRPANDAQLQLDFGDTG